MTTLASSSPPSRRSTARSSRRCRALLDGKAKPPRIAGSAGGPGRADRPDPEPPGPAHRPHRPLCVRRRPWPDERRRLGLSGQRHRRHGRAVPHRPVQRQRPGQGHRRPRSGGGRRRRRRPAGPPRADRRQDSARNPQRRPRAGPDAGRGPGGDRQGGRHRPGGRRRRSGRHRPGRDGHRQQLVRRPDHAPPRRGPLEVCVGQGTSHGVESMARQQADRLARAWRSDATQPLDVLAQFGGARSP